MRSFYSPLSIIIYILCVNLALLIFLGKPISKFFSPLGNGSIKIAEGIYHSPPSHTIYGYLPYWVLDDLASIRLGQLTDIAYFGLRIDGSGNWEKTTDTGEGEPGWVAWNQSQKLADFFARARKSNVRVALTIIAHDDGGIEQFLACRSCWNTLLSNTVEELKAHGLRDVNLDFENVSGVNPDLAESYAELVQFMNEGLDREFGDSKMVVAVFADSFRRARLTDPVLLAPQADALFVMAYDFHYPGSEKAGPVAPLTGGNSRFEFDVQQALNEYLTHVSKEKIILGVPYYGYNFPVQSSAPFSDKLSPYQSITGVISQYYADIVENKRIPLSKRQWSNESQTPYIIYFSADNNELRALHYEDPQSLALKYDLAKELNLRGVGIWALGFDRDRSELWNLLQDKFQP